MVTGDNTVRKGQCSGRNLYMVVNVEWFDGDLPQHGQEWKNVWLEAQLRQRVRVRKPPIWCLN